ncbi:hypothetical protein JCM8202_001874 [Rhodotorula sphaerocarpa]
MQIDSTNAQTDAPPTPEGFVVHTESTTSILFAAPPAAAAAAPSSASASSSAAAAPSSATPSSTAPVFLNPVQEYNRDLSVVAIRTWSELRQQEKRTYWEEGLRRKWARKRARDANGGDGAEKYKREEHQGEGAVEVAEKGSAGEAGGAEAATEADAEAGQDAKRRKADDGAVAPTAAATAPAAEGAAPAPEPASEDPQQQQLPPPPTYKFSLLEALSATGLRAIRYAKELPLLRYVIANDLSASAVEDIRRNIAYNGLAPKGIASLPGAEGLPEEEVKPGREWSKADIEEAKLGKVRANEGDACVFMYQHRAEEARFDCVDLDPYGSAVPFLDAAMNAIADGGLMCVTCTDMGVLAGHNYPEKAFTHYGGVCVNAEYSHEVGLRLVLHALATTAARYGRYIEPQLSLSIDFYVRLFIRVRTGPKEVKALPSKTSLVYYCHTCQTPHWQPFGRVQERVSAKNGNVNFTYHVPSGPPEEVKGDKCGECGGKFHVGGPMWSAPLHDKIFVRNMLAHVEEHAADFKTSDRIKGMLTVALNECEAPLYFSPSKMASLFHATCPPISTFGSALLNGGYEISRSHAVAGSIKTNAPRTFVHDVIRDWIKANPVIMKNVKEGSPAKALLAKEQRHQVSLAPNPNTAAALLDNVKVLRYQINPQANWGPARAAIRGAPPAK